MQQYQTNTWWCHIPINWSYGSESNWGWFSLTSIENFILLSIYSASLCQASDGKYYILTADFVTNWCFESHQRHHTSHSSCFGYTDRWQVYEQFLFWYKVTNKDVNIIRTYSDSRIMGSKIWLVIRSMSNIVIDQLLP